MGVDGTGDRLVWVGSLKRGGGGRSINIDVDMEGSWETRLPLGSSTRGHCVNYCWALYNQIFTQVLKCIIATLLVTSNYFGYFTILRRGSG